MAILSRPVFDIASRFDNGFIIDGFNYGTNLNQKNLIKKFFM